MTSFQCSIKNASDAVTWRCAWPGEQRDGSYFADGAVDLFPKSPEVAPCMKLLLRRSDPCRNASGPGFGARFLEHTGGAGAVNSDAHGPVATCNLSHRRKLYKFPKPCSVHNSVVSV
eukprot:6233828-Amphidinium_carterae.2